MGAIVDESQRKTIEEFVEDARKEGAEVRILANSNETLNTKIHCKLWLKSMSCYHFEMFVYIFTALYNFRLVKAFADDKSKVVKMKEYTRAD